MVPVTTSKPPSARRATHVVVHIYYDAIFQPWEPLYQPRRMLGSSHRGSKSTEYVSCHDNNIGLYHLIRYVNALQTHTISNTLDPPQGSHCSWARVYQHAFHPIPQIILTKESYIHIETRTLPDTSSQSAIYEAMQCCLWMNITKNTHL